MADEIDPHCCGFCYVVGPNRVLVVSGALFSAEAQSFITGGYTCICPITTHVNSLSLELMTIHPQCDAVETREGVALTVSAAAQVKFDFKEGGNANEDLAVAAEQFLGKSVQDIKEVILQTLEGHLRAILATMTVEDVYSDREKFAHEVLSTAAIPMRNMGVEIVSFVLSDISDQVGYLDSLGKRRTAEVKRDAAIGEAQAEKEAGIKEAEAARAHQQVKYQAETAIADSRSQFESQKYEFHQQVNKVKADAEMAYQLRAAQLKQNIRQEEIEIEVIERRKQIEVEEQEIKRKEFELKATVNLPSEAHRFKTEVLAEGNRAKTVAEAEAESAAIKSIGRAEASAISAKGQSEANAMSAKAAAYSKYGSTALVSMALEALPKIAAEISAPLAKTEQIILLPGSTSGSTTTELTKLVAQLPPAIQAVSGIDLSKTFQKVMA